MRVGKVRRELLFLRCYALGVTAIGGAVFLAGASQQTRPQFDRLVVHRIDVVDRSGKLAMVLTDHDDFPAPIMNGKTGHRTSGGDENGIVFYNQDGNEQGALIWDGRVRTKDGAQSVNVLSLDTADSDQLMQLYNGTNGGKHAAALVAWDLPAGSFVLRDRMRAELAKTRDPAQRSAIRRRYREQGIYGFDRFFAGYGEDDVSQVALSDGRGRVRAKLSVSKAGEAQLVFLNAAGQVVASYPSPRAAPAAPR
jgi:hypothetical protein